MKKYKIFLFIFLIIVIIVLSVFLYFNISRGNNQNSKEKALAEVEYVETKLVTLFNELNNIESRNYTVSVKEIESPSKEENSESSSSSNSKESTEQQSQGQEQNQGQQDQGGKTNDSDSQGGQEEKTTQEFEMKETGILTKTEDIDWEHVKTEVENLYTSIPTITLDLYQMQIPRENILAFNQEFDKLTISVKEEKKENTLLELSNIYNYIPTFVDNVSDSDVYKVVIKTKNNLFKAYSKLDSKNWNEISNDVKTTIDTYSSLLSNTNVEREKQQSVNKIYIMLNELQNAVNVQDTSVFLIKYKNVLEEMNNLE